MKVTNRKIGNIIESDVVYPNIHSKNPDFQVLGILDSKYVKQVLEILFNVKQISNKYVIYYKTVNEIDYYLYQHDSSTFILV